MMIENQTHRGIQVSTDGTAGSYIMVPVDRLSQIRITLDLHKIPYWIDSFAVSLDGKPSFTVVNLGRSVNGNGVQAILDGVA